MTIVKNNNFTESLQTLKEVIDPHKTIVLDVETNGLDSYNSNQICGIGVGEPKSGGLLQYYPFRHHQGENLDIVYLEELIVYLNSLDAFIGYNIKFDLHFLEKDGLDTSNKKLIDVIVMVRLVEHSDVKELALTPTGQRRFGIEAVQYDIDTKKELRANKWNKDFSMAPVDFLGEYCKKDVGLTAKLYEQVLQEIKNTHQETIFDLECQLTTVLFDMEKQGISIDNKYALDTQKALQSRLGEVENEILTITHRIKWNHDLPIASPKHDEKEFNVSSPAQIGEIFESMGIESPVKTAKGASSWNEAALSSINHRLAGLIRQYRTLEKLKSTYIEPYISTDIMRTTFCNWGTTTGRLSSREPNLQNLPRNHFKLANIELDESGKQEMRNKISAMLAAKGNQSNAELSDAVLETWAFIGDESFDPKDPRQIAVRRLFVPRPNYSLISFDYSQMEVRVFMSYFRNEVIDSLLKKDDVDFHGEAAKLAFDVKESDAQYKFYRQMAKAITFGTIYGIGNKKLAEQLNTTPKEAGQYKKRYFEGLQGSKEFFNQVVDTVTKRGFIKNRYGRRYKINPKFAYKGVNYLVQGTSADILSERMIEIFSFLSDKKSKILLQVHDEIICEIHDSELETVPFKIKDLLETNSLDIPLTVDMEICTPSWATKKDFKLPTLDDYIDWDVPPIDMYIIPHTQEMITSASQKAVALGPLKNSIEEGRANKAGYLGEEAVAAYLNAEIMSSDEGTDKFHYDLILPDGRRAEVKTKRRTAAPEKHYDVSVADTSRFQKPDLYLFVSLHFRHMRKENEKRIYWDLRDVWLVGQKIPETYFNLATFWPKEKVDPSNGFETSEDMWNVPINELDRVVK